MGVGRGLRVEVEVPGDERTSTPAVVKDLGRCLTGLRLVLLTLREAGACACGE